MDFRPVGKSELRRAVLAARDALAPEVRREAAESVAERALSLLACPPVLGGYLPIRSEIDPLPLMRAFRAQGAEIAVPAIAGDHLEFRRWTPEAALEAQGLGTFAPSAAAPVLRPGLLLVPLAGFDRRGHRLGYGRGFYDRAIASLRAGGAAPMTVGLAFAVQELEAVPDEPFDVALDLVLTEREAVRPIAVPALP